MCVCVCVCVWEWEKLGENNSTLWNAFIPNGVGFFVGFLHGGWGGEEAQGGKWEAAKYGGIRGNGFTGREGDLGWIEGRCVFQQGR